MIFIKTDINVRQERVLLNSKRNPSTQAGQECDPNFLFALEWAAHHTMETVAAGTSKNHINHKMNLIFVFFFHISVQMFLKSDWNVHVPVRREIKKKCLRLDYHWKKNASGGN